VNKSILVKHNYYKMSLDMNEYVNEEMNKMIKNIIRKVVMHCGEMNNFDGERMLESLNLSEMVDVSRSKKCKEKKTMEKKKTVPLPFNGKEREECCRALRQNHGLYTQCETKTDKETRYCKKCEKSQKFGTIEDRLRVNVMEFRDPNGKAPTNFTKVMKKLGLSRIEVEIEASNQGIKLEEFHFEEEKSEKKEKGRPKKAKKTVELEDESTDLFAALVAKANEEESSGSSGEESNMEPNKIILDKIDENTKKIDTIKEKIEANLKAIAENEKDEIIQAKKQADKERKEAELAKKLEEKEAAKQAEIKKKAAEKEEKEAAKLAEIKKKEEAKQAEIQKKEEAKQSEIQKKAEKEAAKQAEIQKKEEAKQAEIQKKAEKEAAKQSAKQAEIQKKAEKEAAKQVEKKPSENKAKKAKEVVPVVASPEEEEEDVVKRFEFEGVKYLKSKKTGIIYNMDQDVIGKWNDKTGKIDFEEAASEEEEEEYDE